MQPVARNAPLCYIFEMAVRVTLRDIARRTGLSTATVSRALHNSSHLPEGTRARVRQVAMEMGYQRDPMLSALASHRWIRRSLADGGAALAALSDCFLEGKNGMAERAAAYGYRLEVYPIGDFPDPQRLADVLYARGILGLVVGPIRTSGFCAAFDWSRFVAVACSVAGERPPVHLVIPNHFRAVQHAWDWAWARGFRRIGLAIFDQPQAIDFHDRCAAFLDRQQYVPVAQRLAVLKVPPWVSDIAELHPGYVLRHEAIRVTRAWVRQEHPELVLGFNDSIRWLLRDAGWHTLETMPFVDLWLHHVESKATGLYLPADEIGRHAVDRLDSLLRIGERGISQHPTTMAIDFAWHEGSGLVGKPAHRKGDRRQP